MCVYVISYAEGIILGWLIKSYGNQTKIINQFHVQLLRILYWNYNTTDYNGFFEHKLMKTELKRTSLGYFFSVNSTLTAIAAA